MYTPTNPKAKQALDTLGKKMKWNPMGLGVPLEWTRPPLTFTRFFLTNAPQHKGKLLVRDWNHRESGARLISISDAGPDACLALLDAAGEQRGAPTGVWEMWGASINEQPTGKPYLVAFWQAPNGPDLPALFDAHNPFDDPREVTMDELERRAATLVS
jgi:hypothetical protein